MIRLGLECGRGRRPVEDPDVDIAVLSRRAFCDAAEQVHGCNVRILREVLD